ncbi:MAG: bifunctional 5,10-methylenetetrahydrofolate dehydrogenase/5,10-methenyltetrahydrofolate cyclohydrolase [bacterium]
MKILDGKKLASQIQQRLKQTRKLRVSLDAILVGNNPASLLYLKKKSEMAAQLGIEFHQHRLPATASEARVVSKIVSLNRGLRVGGVIVQLPLPAKFNVGRVINAIDPKKDVDGMTDANIAIGQILPATGVGILQLLDAYKIKYRHRQIALLGFTRLLNVPLSVYFARLGNQVMVLQKGTRDMNELKQADIIISATGQPGLIKGRYIKPGAVVIDAGISQVKGKVAGDVDAKSVARKAAWLSPVPGGVGPMTVVSLFLNLLDAQKTSSRGPL